VFYVFPRHILVLKHYWKINEDRDKVRLAVLGMPSFYLTVGR
jgi:hypothetical protein